MAPSPSYQPVATGPVATSCDLPAQCATTRASSLRGRFRGDGALAIVSACGHRLGRNKLRPSRATHDDEGVVATGALSWRWRPRHRIRQPPSVRSQWIATLPRNVRRRGRRRYGCAFVAMVPSPSYQHAALCPVAMDCDHPAQCATTRASSLRNSTNGQMQSQIEKSEIENSQLRHGREDVV